MSKMSPSTKKILADVTIFAVSQVILYYGIKYILRQMDPNRKKKDEAKKKYSKVFGRLGYRDMDLNEYEEIIASEVIHPDDIKVSFKDIGGVEHIIDSLKETVIYPLTLPHLFESPSGLLGPPKGVLLHGVPGCGKTMLAQALAKESGATFINLHVSTLTEKWYGESQKLVHALFSLAKKLEPTIIFIDEIDSFLRERRSSDHEATALMKSEFMSLWDGLTSGSMRVMVVGATNRPNDIDSAILRRMPKRYDIRLPEAAQRKKILDIMLKGVTLEKGFDFEELVSRTNGFSGSDLKELCRNAAMVPVRELVRGMDADKLRELEEKHASARPLKLSDFFPDSSHGDEIHNATMKFSSLRDFLNEVTNGAYVEPDSMD